MRQAEQLQNLDLTNPIAVLKAVSELYELPYAVVVGGRDDPKKPIHSWKRFNKENKEIYTTVEEVVKIAGARATLDGREEEIEKYYNFAIVILPHVVDVDKDVPIDHPLNGRITQMLFTIFGDVDSCSWGRVGDPKRHILIRLSDVPVRTEFTQKDKKGMSLPFIDFSDKDEKERVGIEFVNHVKPVHLPPAFAKGLPYPPADGVNITPYVFNKFTGVSTLSKKEFLCRHWIIQAIALLWRYYNSGYRQKTCLYLATFMKHLGFEKRHFELLVKGLEIMNPGRDTLEQRLSTWDYTEKKIENEQSVRGFPSLIEEVLKPQGLSQEEIDKIYATLTNPRVYGEILPEEKKGVKVSVNGVGRTEKQGEEEDQELERELETLALRSAETVKEMFSLPYIPEFPKGFYVEGNVLYRVIKKKKEILRFPISPVCIISRILEVPEGGTYIEVLSKRGRFTTELAPDIEMKRLVCSQLGAVLRSEQWSALVEYLSEYLRLNGWGNEGKKVIPIAKVLTKTGWHGERFYLPYLQFPDHEVVWKNEKLVQAFRVSGRFDKELLRKFLFTPAGMLVGVVVSAPLVKKLLKLKNFFVNVTGLRGIGKTTAIAYAMSLLGHPDVLKNAWDTTSAGLEGYLEAFTDMPFWIEEFQTVESVKEFVRAIFRVEVEKGRIRRRRDLGLEKQTEFRNIVLTSAETDLENIITQFYTSQKMHQPQGVYRRVLEIKAGEDFLTNYLTGEKLTPEELVEHMYGEKDEISDEDLDFKKLLGLEGDLGNYGHLGVMLGEFLNSLAGNKELLRELVMEKRKMKKMFSEILTNGLQLVYTAIAMGYWVLEKLDIISSEERQILIEKLKEHAEESKEDYREKTNLFERFITKLRDFYYANRACFKEKYYVTTKDGVEERWTNPSTVLGVRFDEHVFLFPSTFEKVCFDNGFVKSQILKILDREGLLKRTESDRKRKKYQTLVSVEGEKLRGYYVLNVLDAEVFETTVLKEPVEVIDEQEEPLVDTEEQIDKQEEAQETKIEVLNQDGTTDWLIEQISEMYNISVDELLQDYKQDFYIDF